MSIPPVTPLAYEGTVAVPYINRTFAPTSSNNTFAVPTLWINTQDKTAYILVAKPLGVADWLLVGGGSGVIDQIDTPDGAHVVPSAGIINFLNGTGMNITGSGNNITFNASGSSSVTLDGNTGTASGSTINLVSSLNNGGGTVAFVGDNSATMTLNLTDADGNVCIGYQSGTNATVGGAGGDVAIGNQTLTNGSYSGGSNVAIGNGAMFGCVTAYQSVGIGANALTHFPTGNFNTAVGAGAGSNSTSNGDHNIFIGNGAGSTLASTESSNILINHYGISSDNNTIRIGTQGSSGGQQNKCFIAGVAGVTVSNVNMVTVNTSTGQLGSQAIPSAVAFLSTVSATQTDVTGDGTSYTIIFDTLNHDTTSGAYNTSNGIFTVPTTGFYDLTAWVSFNGMTSSHTAGKFQFVIGGSTQSATFRANFYAISDAGFLATSISQIYYLTATTTVQVVLTVSNGTKVVDILGTTDESGNTVTGFACSLIH